MRHMKVVQVPATPAREAMTLDRVTCDFCGEAIAPDVYDAEKVVVSHKTGENFPTGGSGRLVSLDICGRCFDTKLVPWAAAQGAVATTTEWDW